MRRRAQPLAEGTFLDRRLLLHEVLTSCASQYAFGCSEIVFNPFLKWFTRGGPFSKLYMRYLWADSPLPCKFSNSSCVARHVQPRVNALLT